MVLSMILKPRHCSYPPNGQMQFQYRMQMDGGVVLGLVPFFLVKMRVGSFTKVWDGCLFCLRMKVFGCGMNNSVGYGQKNLFTPISIHWIKVGSFTTEPVKAVLYSMHSGMNCGGLLPNESHCRKIYLFIMCQPA